MKQIIQGSRIMYLSTYVLICLITFVQSFRLPSSSILRPQRSVFHISIPQSIDSLATKPSLSGLRHDDTTSTTSLCSSKSAIEDDGFSTRYGRKLKFWGKIRLILRNFIKRFLSRFFPQSPGSLILVRHGESLWNFNSTFTGWVDVDLSDRGRREMEHAGRLLLELGYSIDVSYTSRLKRAIRSNWIMLRELNQIFRPVFKSYRLNERMYGALEGMSKPGLARELGKEAVISYRSSLYARPPPMTNEHPYWHGTESKYSDLDPKELPLTESLEDCMKRSLPLWESRILPDLKKGLNVLVVAHGNSLRGIVKHIDNLDPDQIQSVGIPNGIPLVYKFDTAMKPIPQNGSVYPLSGEFLEKKGLLRNALALEEELSTKIPGYDLFDANLTGFEKVLRYSPPLDQTLTSLFRLDKERKLLEYCNGLNCVSNSSSFNTNENFEAGDYSADTVEMVTISRKFNQSDIDQEVGDVSPEPIERYPRVNFKLSALGEISTTQDVDSADVSDDTFFFPRQSSTSPITSTSPTSTESSNDVDDMTMNDHSNEDFSTTLDDGTINSLRGPLLVIIRHGKTEHNKLGLFTGWEDAPLAMEGNHIILDTFSQYIFSIAVCIYPSLSGRNEARDAGKLMRAHGLRFDIVYTSWLSRAIETAWLVLNELDALWLPLIKSWRLNERMYGALTGLSKKMIGQRHGDKQLKLWRRSYATKPPKVSSFSHHYPGNDERYVKYVRDVRISIFETVMRSMAERRFQIHRAFPKTESLKDCMERTIPYFIETIKPNSIDLGKNVLIASSENAIRGLLMHLCEIPPERISEVEIPTGLPLVFDVKNKCIKLLDDGKNEDMLSKYNFGTSPDLLFKPCDLGISAEKMKSLTPEDLELLVNSGRTCFVDQQGRLFAYNPCLRLPGTEPNNKIWTSLDVIYKNRVLSPESEGSATSALL